MGTQSEPNHKVDLCRREGFQEFEIKVAIQHQRLVAEEGFERCEGLQMIEVARLGCSSNGARRIGEKMTRRGAPTIGCGMADGIV